VRRSGRAGALERLLSAAYIYPFRCQRCGRRFFALTWGARYARPTSERREFERVVIRLPAKLTGGAESAEAETIDVSIDGCSVRTDARLPAGTTVRLTLRLPGSAVEVEEAVVRVPRDGRLGLHFVKIEAAQQRRLADFIHAVTAPIAGRQTRVRRLSFEVVLVALVGLVLIVLLLQLFGGGGPGG
jgi:hypothetical protein